MLDGLVPDDVRRRLYDAALEAAARVTHRRWPRLARLAAWFRSDSESRARFAQTLESALDNFIDAVEQNNAALAQSIREEMTIWESPVLHEAIREIVASPGTSRPREWSKVHQLFVSQIPMLRDDPGLADSVLRLLLSCLAAELCLLPEFRDLYRFHFERQAAQSTIQLSEHLARITEFVRAGSGQPPIASLPVLNASSVVTPSNSPHVGQPPSLSAGTQQAGIWTLAAAPHPYSTIVVVGPDTRRVALLPTDNSPDYAYLEFFGDKDTILEASVLLARTHSHATIARYPASWLPATLRTMPLVVVGGPTDDEGVGGNRVARQVMDHMQVPVSYHDDCEGIDYAGSTYRTQFDPSGRLTLDWGVVVRLRNPWNAHARVLLIQGIHTHGVLGAFRAISDPTLMEVADASSPLASPDPLFAALVRVAVLDGVAASTRLDSSLIRRLTFD